MITNEQYKGGAGSMTEYRAQRVDTYEDALSIALYRCERFGEKQVIRIFKDTPRNRAMGRYLVRAYDSLGERRTRLYQRLRDRGLTREQAAAMTYGPWWRVANEPICTVVQRKVTYTLGEWEPVSS